MITESCDAWLLSKRPSGNSSVYLSLFTRDKGIITCLYKGGLSSKKQAVLQPFMPLWAALNYSKGRYYIASVEAYNLPLSLQKIALFSGLYVNELISYALKPFDAHPELYEAYEYTLNSLALMTEPLAREALLRRFEWVLLKYCGQPLAFHEHDQHPTYQFAPGLGFVASEKGISQAEVSAIVEGMFDDVKVLKSAKLVMRQAVDFLVGKPLVSRRLFTV